MRLQQRLVTQITDMYAAIHRDLFQSAGPNQEEKGSQMKEQAWIGNTSLKCFIAEP